MRSPRRLAAADLGAAAGGGCHLAPPAISVASTQDGAVASTQDGAVALAAGESRGGSLGPSAPRPRGQPLGRSLRCDRPTVGALAVRRRNPAAPASHRRKAQAVAAAALGGNRGRGAHRRRPDRQRCRGGSSHEVVVEGRAASNGLCGERQRRPRWCAPAPAVAPPFSPLMARAVPARARLRSCTRKWPRRAR